MTRQRIFPPFFTLLPWDAAGVDTDILGQLSGFDSLHRKSDWKRRNMQNILGKKVEERSSLATFLELSLPDNFFLSFIILLWSTFWICVEAKKENISRMFFQDSWIIFNYFFQLSFRNLKQLSIPICNASLERDVTNKRIISRFIVYLDTIYQWVISYFQCFDKNNSILEFAKYFIWSC